MASTMMAMPPFAGPAPPSSFTPIPPQPAPPGTSPGPAGTPNSAPKIVRPMPTSAAGTLNGPPSGNNHAIPLSARRAEPLDLRTVERRGQPNQAPERVKQERLFGIPEAPTFRPTEEEFRDPMEYMRKLAPEGSKYGIVKIIPPDGWNPPFAINSERFHFRTRRQELNSVEGGNRVNNDYLDQLAKFHKQNGHNLNRFPSVDKRPLDLYRLKKTVERKGGFDAVCKGKRWAEVGRDLGYSGKIMSSLSTSLKNSYQKWLLPYERYLEMARPGVQHQIEMLNGGPYTPSPGPSPAKKSNTNTPTEMKEETPLMRATAALHSTVNGHSPHPPTTHPHLPPPAEQQLHPPPLQHQPSSGGFTAVNAGGGFTAVNAPVPPAASFTSVNSAHDSYQSGITPTLTPQHSNETPTSNGMQPFMNGAQAIAPHPEGVAALKRQRDDNILTADEIEAMNRRSKRLRKDIPTVAGSNMHHSRMSAKSFQSGRDRNTCRPGEKCENCDRSEDSFKFVSCDSCDCVFHLYCLEPPLKDRPVHEWHCPRCLVGTNEYGFEEGDVHSLIGFQRKASEFKTHHFNNSIPRQFSPFTDTKRQLEEEDIEREFWRLVEDLSDTVEVEYGADIHSTTHGSGFPTIEKQPRDPYSSDPWNLNILPLDKESLFRHIKSDISGMTVPWLYVGMVFSTFCWHNEDHYAYSANYQHFGQTKTWYGIPGEDAEKFEKAMRDEVPELFDMQPDLLFQLVTLARPEKLRQAGVRVFALDQRAGQFVVTFPQAYHAGFNHGFNFNEAVNFAPHDWEEFGEKGVQRLRDYRKQPCFSHDELLVTAASRDHTIRTGKWLAPALERMRDEELAARKTFLEGAPEESGMASEDSYKGPRYEALPDFIDPDTEEEETICTFCKCFCYLSRYQCKKTGKYLCSLHAGTYECCDGLEHERYTGRDGTHRISYRMTDDALVALVKKVVDKANIPETWAGKVDNELDENPRPSLKHLRTLLTEGEKIQYELPQLADLRRFVERCNEWVEEATNYITRKQQNRRKNEKAWRKGTAKQLEMEERDKELRKVDNITRLLAKADDISFDCPEINTLRDRAEAIADFQRDANSSLNNIRSKTTAEFEELVIRGREFHVDMPEIDSLERVVKRLKWDDMAKAKRPNHDTQRQDQTLKDIEKFIEEGKALGVPDTNPDIVFFREHKAQGELWEQKAQELMSVEQVHYQQLDALSRQATTLAVRAETLSAVDAILKKQREVEDKIASLIERTKDPDFRQRPKYKDCKEVMDALEELQSKPNGTIDLEKEQRRHEDWMRKGKKLFGKANAPLHILHQHMQIVEARNDACYEISDEPRLPVEPASRNATPEDHAPLSAKPGEVFCICRRSEAGMMIECEVCHEWYHGKCLKIARGKVKEDDLYTCPVCDWRVKIPRDAARPKLEDLQAWYDEVEALPFQPDEEKTLGNIVDHAQTYRDFIKPIIHSDVPTTPEEVQTMRFHLRKIEGADILLAEETNFLRQELHKWNPVAPDPPPQVQQSGSTRKPRPTKQQKLMASLGITDPNDLPQQYKIKPHVAKRKASEAMGKNPPLQPAGGPVMDSPGGSQPSSVPASAIDVGPPVEKRFFTPLAIQVLEQYADAPVVSRMLETDRHMNRDKLLKMKAILESDHSVWDDLPTFKTRFETMPTPASHTPAYSYETAADRRKITSSTYRDSPSFRRPSEPNSAGGPSQPPRLPSPSQYHSLDQYPTHTPPQLNVFDTQLFESAHGGMFGSPAHAAKPAGTSPNSNNLFDPGRQGMFDSPKVPTGGSPMFGNMDVFGDLMGDQFAGLDGAGEGKEAGGSGAVVASTEAAGPAGRGQADTQMTDPALLEGSGGGVAQAVQQSEREGSLAMEDFVHQIQEEA